MEFAERKPEMGDQPPSTRDGDVVDRTYAPSNLHPQATLQPQLPR